jgi:hypothetical protein
MFKGTQTTEGDCGKGSLVAGGGLGRAVRHGILP